MKVAMADFVDKLQEEIFDETKATYGQEVFSRWQNPKLMGKMVNGSSVGRMTGRCGDSMQIYLLIMNDYIEKATFLTDGCGSSVACGSVAAELASGKDLDEAAKIGGDTILTALGGLPEEEKHCAFLAAETLMAAIHQWMVARIKTDES